MPAHLRPVTPQTVPISEFLADFSDSLCTSTAEQLTPLYTPDVLQEAQPVFQRFGEALLPSQANVTAAMAHAFRFASTVICSSEMSTGKTRMGAGAAALLNSQRTLVLCPPHLVGKWKSEIQTLLPGAYAAILRSISDVQAFALVGNTTPWPLFGILSRERAKLSFSKRPALVKKLRRSEEIVYETYLCPQCGTRVDNKDDIPVTPRTLKPGQQCKVCHSALWTYDPEGPRRYAIADYIGKKHPRLFDLLVTDEVQEMKARGSAQGLAFALLMAKCRRAIALTGTLSSGKSTSLFHLLWRMNPPLKAAYKNSDEARWVDRFGVWETRTTDQDLHRVLVMGKESKRRVHVTVRERPGISPQILPLMLGNAVFFQLRDLGVALPPYRETVEECLLTPELAANYDKLKQAARELIPAGRKARDGHLVSSLIQALLAYPDRAWQEEVITDKVGNVRFRLDPLPADVVLPKEKVLINRIKAERDAGRGVMVFCTHTQTRDITQRLHTLLTNAGLRSVVLPASIPPERRMKWIDDRSAEGLDVLITNPRLVSTGLDLVNFPCVIWQEVDYSTYLVRQASRRSWRPFIQKQRVEVVFSLYKQTVQEHAWALVAAGIKSALQTEGDLTSEGISDYQQPDDLMTQLVRQVLDRNATVLSAESMFAELATMYHQDPPEPVAVEATPHTYPPTPPELPVVAPVRVAHKRPDRETSEQLTLFAA